MLFEQLEQRHLLALVTYLFEATGGIEGKLTYETNTIGEELDCSVTVGNCALYQGAIKSLAASDGINLNVHFAPPANSHIIVFDNGHDHILEPPGDGITFAVTDGAWPNFSKLVGLDLRTENSSLYSNANLPTDINLQDFEDTKSFQVAGLGAATITRFARAATVGDFVWRDANANGIQDPGEEGIPGVAVEVYESILGDPIATDVTDANGQYSFELFPGDYFFRSADFRVTQDGIENLAFTTIDVGTDQTKDSDVDSTDFFLFSLAPGQENLNLDVGMFTPASIAGRVWEDLNGDGVQNLDEEDAGLAGVTVRLLDPELNEIATTTTANSIGAYEFNDLAPGDYFVEVVNPNPAPITGLRFTEQDAGVDNRSDSDVDVNTGRTAVFTLTEGANSSTETIDDNNFIDAGLYLPVEISGIVWDDADGDGIREAAEPRAADVDLRLLDADMNPVLLSRTDGNGAYVFSELRPGDYFVEVIKPAEFREFTTQDVDDDSTDSDVNSQSGVTPQLMPRSGDVFHTVDAGLFRTPDIVAQRIFFDGGDVRFEWTIRGSDLPNSSKVALYWSSDGVFDASDSLAFQEDITESDSTGNRLLEGFNYSRGVPLALLARPHAGATSLLLVVNPNNNIPDEPAHNNTASHTYCNTGAKIANVHLREQNFNIDPIKSSIDLNFGAIQVDFTVDGPALGVMCKATSEVGVLPVSFKRESTGAVLMTGDSTGFGVFQLVDGPATMVHWFTPSFFARIAAPVPLPPSPLPPVPFPLVVEFPLTDVNPTYKFPGTPFETILREAEAKIHTDLSRTLFGWFADIALFDDPGETALVVTGPGGQSTGSMDGQNVVTNIPGSFYDPSGPLVGVVQPPSGTYTAAVTGMSTGKFSLATGLAIDGVVQKVQTFEAATVNGLTTSFTTNLDADTGEFETTLDAKAEASAGVLQLVGTNQNDRVVVFQDGDNIGVSTSFGGRHTFAAGDVNTIIVNLGPGNDQALITSAIGVAAIFSGGEGNDLLKGGGANDTLDGGPGNDIILGGAGNDILLGGAGRDVLHARGDDVAIGGLGADLLLGDSGQQLFIAGSTAFDEDDAALEAIRDEWTNASHDRETRIANLRGDDTGPGFPNRLNGDYFLVDEESDATVLDDLARDLLFGGLGDDWLLFSLLQDGP